MKNMICLLVITSMVLPLQAQQLSSILFTEQSQPPKMVSASLPSTTQFAKRSKTRSGSVYIRYIDHVALQEGISPLSLSQAYTLSYVFPDSLMNYNPPNQNFGISFRSLAQILDPQSTIITSWAAPNDILVTNADAYTIDSVWIGGSYAKVSNAVDTIKMSLVHSGGNNLPEFQFTDPLTTQNYNVTVVPFQLPLYAPADLLSLHQKAAVGAPAAYVTQRELTNADSSDYIMGATSFVPKYIGLSANNFLVPAGENVAVSFTFLPGFSWTPGDTIGNNNKFLFGSYEPFGAQSYMPFYVNDRNMSFVVTKDTSGWSGYYIPTVAYSSPTYPTEIHDIVWKVSCATCPTNSPTLLPEQGDLARVQLYPNPSSDKMTLLVETDEPIQSSSFSVYTIQGQWVLSENLNTTIGQKEFKKAIDLSHLPSGLYYYVLRINDQTVKNKLHIVR